MHKDEIRNQLILSLMDARTIKNTSENIVSILESLFHKESSIEVKEFAEYIKELHVLCDLVECLENHEKYLEKLHELGK